MTYKVWITYKAESSIVVEADSFNEAEELAIESVGDMNFDGDYNANTIQLLED